MEGWKKMWDKVISTIKLLKSKGLRVDAIGWQAHLDMISLVMMI